MKLFVTGGTGFIGAHFIRSALSAGHEVWAPRRTGSRPRIELNAEPHWVDGDLEQDFRLFLEKCDRLVHLAAFGVTSGGNDWERCFRWNVNASLALWLQAYEAGIKKLVISGSCFEYGKSGEHFSRLPVDAPLRPIGAYASSKAAATMAAIGFAAQTGASIDLLRPFYTYGEGDAEGRFWTSLKRAALGGDDFAMTAGDQVLDFVPVTEVADGFLEALDSKTDEGTVSLKNLGTGAGCSVKDFAEKQWKRWNATGVLQIGAIPYRTDEVMRYVADL